MTENTPEKAPAENSQEQRTERLPHPPGTPAEPPPGIPAAAEPETAVVPPIATDSDTVVMPASSEPPPPGPQPGLPPPLVGVQPPHQAELPPAPVPPAWQPAVPRPSSFRLRRSRSDRMIAGVCGGYAAALGVDATVIRLALVLATVLGVGAGVILYAVSWILMPLEPEQPPAPAP